MGLITMTAALDNFVDPDGTSEPSFAPRRISDEDLLRNIRHDLSVVYTDVLCTPIPNRIAAVLANLENALLPPALRA
jgi:hypothetical protein